jgi:predicted transcriptional regulator
MNNKLLTGARRALFLEIAKHRQISQSQLCALSYARGGDIQRLNHHLMGLEHEGFIEIVHRGKRGKYQYRITKGKGEKMLQYLQDEQTNLSYQEVLFTFGNISLYTLEV